MTAVACVTGVSRLVLNDGHKVTLKYIQSHGRQSRAVNTRFTVLMASLVISCHCPFLFRYFTAYVGRAKSMRNDGSFQRHYLCGRRAHRLRRHDDRRTHAAPWLPVVSESSANRRPRRGRSISHKTGSHTFVQNLRASSWVWRSFLCFTVDVAFTKESRKKSLV